MEDSTTISNSDGAADLSHPRLAVSTGAFYPDLSTTEAIHKAAQLGFREIEVMMQSDEEYRPGHYVDLAAFGADRGVTFHAVHLREQSHDFVSSDPRQQSLAMDRFECAVEGAAAIGARTVVWHGPCDFDRDQGKPHLLAILEQMGEICAAGEVSLALENTSRCALKTYRDISWIASKLPAMRNGVRVGFAFDPFQASEAEVNPFMVLRAMEGRLLDVHLSDRTPGDPSRRRLLPGQGELPWSSLIRAIAATSYSGPLTLECDLRTATRDDIVAVHRLLQVPANTDADICAAPLPEGIREGILLFNAGEFYECHEVIEAEWHAEPEPVRDLYQAILQIGIAFHHARNGNRIGANNLLTSGIKKLRLFPPECQGIDVSRLLGDAELWSQRFHDSDWPLPESELDFPKVHMH